MWLNQKTVYRGQPPCTRACDDLIERFVYLIQRLLLASWPVRVVDADDFLKQHFQSWPLKCLKKVYYGVKRNTRGHNAHPRSWSIKSIFESNSWFFGEVWVCSGSKKNITNCASWIELNKCFVISRSVGLDVKSIGAESTRRQARAIIKRQVKSRSINFRWKYTLFPQFWFIHVVIMIDVSKILGLVLKRGENWKSSQTKRNTVNQSRYKLFPVAWFRPGFGERREKRNDHENMDNRVDTKTRQVYCLVFIEHVRNTIIDQLSLFYMVRAKIRIW